MKPYGRKKGNVLFHDTLIAFYWRLYGSRHMVKDQSTNDRGYPLLLLHGVRFPSATDAYSAYYNSTGPP